MKAQELDRSETVSGVRSFSAGEVYSESPGYCTGVCLVAPEGRNGASVLLSWLKMPDSLFLLSRFSLVFIYCVPLGSFLETTEVF